MAAASEPTGADCINATASIASDVAKLAGRVSAETDPAGAVIANDCTVPGGICVTTSEMYCCSELGVISAQLRPMFWSWDSSVVASRWDGVAAVRFSGTPDGGGGMDIARSSNWLWLTSWWPEHPSSLIVHWMPPAGAPVSQRAG